MAIIRSPRADTGWYALDRRIAADARLSWAARGLLVYLLTKPDHWRVSVAHLQKETVGARITTGRDGIYALLAELESAGYVTRSQQRGEDGRMSEIDYCVAEASAVSPLPAEPDTVQPLTAEPTLDKTDLKKRQRNTSTPRPPAGAVWLPDWVPEEAWTAFVDMRKKIRAPLTPLAIKRTLAELDELRKDGNDPEAVLWQSVQRSWRGVFPLKKQGEKGAQWQGAVSRVESSNAAALEEFRRRIAADPAEKGTVIDA